MDIVVCRASTNLGRGLEKEITPSPFLFILAAYTAKLRVFYKEELLTLPLSDPCSEIPLDFSGSAFHILKVLLME